MYRDEVSSGEQNERLMGYVTGMVDYGDEVMSTAADFYSDPNALQEAIDKYGPEVVEEFGFDEERRELSAGASSYGRPLPPSACAFA